VLERLEDRTVLSNVLVVTTQADSGPGSLRDAINLANQSSPSIIDFAVTGAIDLTSALSLRTNITIQGPGTGSLTVQRATVAPFGIFTIGAQALVSISGLTIANGDAPDFGGAIHNTGTLRVTNCTLGNNAAVLEGGGIFNSGTLSVTNCTLDNDSANDLGGGISNESRGTATVANCTLDNDSAVQDGGAIFNAATLMVANSNLDNNTAARDGGGIASEAGTATVTSSNLDNDFAAFEGGGIYNYAGMTAVTNSTLDHDIAGEGGGVSNDGEQIATTLTLTSCALTNDSATGDGGGIFNHAATATLTVMDCTLGHDSASAGGGISNSGTLTATSCALTNDSATGDGGGIFNHAATATATLTVMDCTLGRDSASAGGGISNSGTLTATNCTLTDDIALTPGAFGGPDGGGIFNAGAATLTLNNTIVADNTLGDVVGDLSASSSNNLIGDGTGMTGISDGTQGNQVGTAANPINPLLGTLQDNGGPTQTLALLPGSPAIDAGSNALAVDANNNPLTTDQRGVARVVNGIVDIGAFESRPFTIAITGGNGQSATVDTGFLNPLVVTVASPYGDPVQGGVVTFTAPAGGAGATFPARGGTAATAPIDPAGQAAVAVTANMVAGGYAVMANARGATFAAGFSLANTPGAAYQITPATGAAEQSTTVGYAFAAPLQVTVTDQFGNAVPFVSITYAAPTSGPGGMVVGGAVVTTNAQGIAAPTFVANTLAGGPYSVTATVGGLSGSPVSFRLTNTPDAASTFVVSGFPSPTTAGDAYGFTVTAWDRYGNVANGYSGLVHFTSSDPHALLPADAALTDGTGSFSATLETAGTRSLTATDAAIASLTGTQSSIRVNPGVASSLRIAAPSTVSPGVPFTFTITALDAYGNVATGYSGTIRFSSSDKKAALPGYAILTNGTGSFTATLTTKGNQTLMVTDIASPGLTRSVTIFVDPPVTKK
jgi:hypothetical protein